MSSKTLKLLRSTKEALTLANNPKQSAPSSSSSKKEKIERKEREHKEREHKVQPEQKASGATQKDSSVNEFLNAGVIREEGPSGNALLNGPGKRVRDNGVIEEGMFENGQLRKGKIIYPNKVEQGNFQNGQLHGAGMRSNVDGTTESGIFQNGILQTP